MQALQTGVAPSCTLRILTSQIHKSRALTSHWSLQTFSPAPPACCGSAGAGQLWCGAFAHHAVGVRLLQGRRAAAHLAAVHRAKQQQLLHSNAGAPHTPHLCTAGACVVNLLSLTSGPRRCLERAEALHCGCALRLLTPRKQAAQLSHKSAVWDYLSTIHLAEAEMHSVELLMSPGTCSSTANWVTLGARLGEHQQANKIEVEIVHMRGGGWQCRYCLEASCC